MGLDREGEGEIVRDEIIQHLRINREEYEGSIPEFEDHLSGHQTSGWGARLNSLRQPAFMGVALRYGQEQPMVIPSLIHNTPQEKRQLSLLTSLARAMRIMIFSNRPQGWSRL
jgi:hypothetical protein